MSLLFEQGRSDSGRARPDTQDINLINLYIKREGDIVANQLKVRFIAQFSNIALIACIKIIHANYIIPSGHQSIAQMRAQKPGASGYENSFSVFNVHRQDL